MARDKGLAGIRFEHEITVRVLRQLGGMLGLASPAKLLPASIVESYSRRQLGHDEDALNVISGVLNSVTGQDSDWGHVWGILYERHGKALEDKLYLLWVTKEQGRRRDKFPSWSPLGWTAHIQFLDRWEAGVNNEFVEICSQHDGIWVPWTSLTAAVREQFRLVAPPESRFFKVTALTVRLPLVRKGAVDPQGRITRQRYCLCLDDMLIEPHWDSATEDLRLGSTVLCVVVASSFLLLLDPRENLTAEHLPVQATHLPVYARVGAVSVRSGDKLLTIDVRDGSLLPRHKARQGLNSTRSDEERHNRSKAFKILKGYQNLEGAREEKPDVKRETFVLA